jgi:hypothetical protein
MLRLSLVFLLACGGQVDQTGDSPDDAGNEGIGHGRGPDSGNGYVDPHCGDTGGPRIVNECDIKNPITSCTNGEGCYPVAIPPNAPCESEIYGTSCLPAGVGTQGAPCTGKTNCSPGYVCLITGSDTQCARLCDLNTKGSCPTGYVCGPIDVTGFAACL